MLVEKMSAPPVSEYVGLYVKYITRFNPNVNVEMMRGMGMGEAEVREERQKFEVLTMNLLNRLCEDEYL